MKNPFKNLIHHAWVSLQFRIYADYFDRVAHDANTSPTNKIEEELEGYLLNGLITATKQLEIDPAAVAVISPYLRQNVAKELAAKFKDKKFKQHFLDKG